jgi:hypothetical protein
MVLDFETVTFMLYEAKKQERKRTSQWNSFVNNRDTMQRCSKEYYDSVKESVKSYIERANKEKNIYQTILKDMTGQLTEEMWVKNPIFPKVLIEMSNDLKNHDVISSIENKSNREMNVYGTVISTTEKKSDAEVDVSKNQSINDLNTWIKNLDGSISNKINYYNAIRNTFLGIRTHTSEDSKQCLEKSPNFNQSFYEVDIEELKNGLQFEVE